MVAIGTASEDHQCERLCSREGLELDEIPVPAPDFPHLASNPITLHRVPAPAGCETNLYGCTGPYRAARNKTI